MQTKRIPLAILTALELGFAGCTGASTQPCLKVLSEPPPAEQPEGKDTKLGPCLMVAEDPEATPCLSPPEPPPEPPPDGPPVTACLDIAPPDEPPVTPCLKVPPPKDDPPPKPDEPRVGPCLKVAPPRDEPKVGPCLRVARPRSDKRPKAEPIDEGTSPKSSGGMARADVLERFAETLPPDVLAKLRARKG